jgi:type IV pilus assembly protein PilB
VNDVERQNIERAVAALALRYRLISPAHAQAMIMQARSGSVSLIDLIRKQVREVDLLKAVSHALGGKPTYYDFNDRRQLYRVDEALLRRAEIQYLKQFSAIPLQSARDGSIAVAIAYLDPSIVDYVRNVYGDAVKTYLLASRDQIQNKLALFSSSVAIAALADDSPTTVNRPAAAKNTGAPPAAVRAVSSVVTWLDNVLGRAVAEGASDIHMSLREDASLKLEFRIDGILRHIDAPTGGRAVEIIASVMSKTDTMDQSNMRIPQDGTFSFEAAGRSIDARVAILPESNGPYMVIRLLDSKNIRVRLDDMGFSDDALNAMREAVNLSQGTVLVSGPTGSGKSTTLYGLLREVDAVSKNVITIEDPVEYRLEGIKQIPIRNNVADKSKSIDFQRALRTILRMDPDVLLVGEVRDTETAKAAMDAAITGHLVLSTVHANSAIGIYTRLMEMGVPGYMVADAIDLGVAQRLLRRLHDCAHVDAPTRDERDWFETQGLPVPAQVGHAVGCGACGTGYKGRLAVVEYLRPSRRFRALVAQQATYEELEAEATATGFKAIVHDGLRHAAAGRTTVSEVSRVLNTSAEDRH